MGDMKTPDFDDLLAAFDIPDMVDPKAAIESGPSDDHENQLKQANSGAAINEEVSSSGQDVGVSVIVKNTRNMDNGEHGGTLQKKVGQLHTNANTHFSVGNGLHNGLLSTILPNNRYTKNGWRATREEGLPVNTSTSTLNQFSPISSAEEFDDDDKIEVDDPMDKHCSQSFTKPTPNNFTVNLSYHKREDQNPKEPISLENVSKPTAKSDSGQTKPEINNNTLSCAKPDYTTKLRKHEDEAKEAVPKPHGHVGNEVEELPQLSSVSVLGLAQAKIKSSAKLSSCIAAIAALSAKKSSAVDSGLSECPTTKIKSIPISPHGESTKEAKESSSAPETPQERELALEVAKRLLSRQPDSPGSVTSEGSGKGSPASPTGTTPVIPKVRIKTIKTSSGHIKRTVTRVLPEFDVEGPKRKDHSSDSCVRISPVLTSSTSNTNISSPTQTSLSTTVVATSGGPTLEVTKQMTIKPVATAFLPVSAVKTAGSQVINLKLANNTTVKATVIPAASVQSASSAILKAANALQQQTVMVPASSLAKAKLVPKTVHFTNLNLLPQASTPSDLHQALSSCKQLQNQKPQQQMKLQVCQVPKKLSRVQVFGSAQSSVVDAFNKVLSSVNPVPVYVPNLSPPTSACISIPSRGYKCLECGDSFALEKSLTQHYERRSVRIEVTCNHCAKNLVFYNKCSLLSHARGHKDKGMVMQCSHLILKPIPAEQMITTSPPAGSNVTLTVVNAQTQSSKTAGSGTYTAVISAPGSAPLMAAMPLEDDVTKLSRHSLKCLECNQMFQDANSLAMHYQQASESNGQKTCSICQMLLPNQCSFVSHQRIHQHKSPYICPECGASCRSVHFQSHVTRSCLHYTRRVGYRCVHCSVIFDEIAALKSHIQNTHCEVFYKCPVCPMAFKSAPGTHSHANTQHPGVKIAEPKLIYKCSMCDTVFTLQSLLHTHFDQHIGNHKVSVFKCPDCSVHYAQKQLMLDHIKTTHGTLKTIEGPPNLGINLPLSTKPTHSNSNTNSPNSNKDGGGNVNGQDWGDKKPPPRPLKTTNSNVSGDLKNHPGPGYTCGGCDLLFTSREVFVTHMKRDHGKTLKKHPCRQCDKSFSSPHSLCRHNRLKHKGLRKVYTCPHCPALSQPFTKRVLLEQHVELMHGIRDPELKSMDADRMEAIPDKTVNPKRKQEEAEGSLGPHCRDSDPQPLKKLKVNVLKVHRCAVCGFTSEDLASFHGHIPQHKSDGSSYQCQECGLCYTSHHSLARHLFIVHRLKDPQGLVRRGGGVGRGDGDDQSQRENQLDVADENDEGKPSTRCKVCGKVFETEGHLNTHMRTHGMAFIKSKRLSAAEK